MSWCMMSDHLALPKDHRMIYEGNISSSGSVAAQLVQHIGQLLSSSAPACSMMAAQTRCMIKETGLLDVLRWMSFGTPSSRSDSACCLQRAPGRP